MKLKHLHQVLCLWGRLAFQCRPNRIQFYKMDNLSQLNLRLSCLKVAVDSLPVGSYYCFINISTVSSSDLSAIFTSEAAILQGTMFYASAMDTKLLSEKIQYLLLIRAKVLALAASPQIFRYAVSCLESRVQFYCQKVTEFLIIRAENNEQKQKTLLSARETEVLKALAQGKGSKEIASALNLCIRTIEDHRQKIMKNHIALFYDDKKYLISSLKNFISIGIKGFGPCCHSA